MRAPSRAGSIGRVARRSISVAVSVLIVALVIVGGLSLLTTAGRPSASDSSSHLTPALPPATHGDLVVGSGQTFVIQPPLGSPTYYQGGNITVQSGGTLIVENVTLSFVQFVSDTGTPMQRLSHLYQFVDAGTVNFYHSTLTTDVHVINAYAKLDLTVTGHLTAWDSALAFPGWINVQGATAALTLNASAITGNPGVVGLREPAAILGDTMYAPAISVTGGAQLNSFASTIGSTYADNTLANTYPQPIPLAVYSQLLGGGDNNFSNLQTPSDSANLSQDWLYPNADFQTGTVSVTWVNSNVTLNGFATLNVWYDGTKYVVAPLTFVKGGLGVFTFPLPPALLHAITQGGVLNYLNWTGDFGVGPSKIAIDLSGFAGPRVAIVSAILSIIPTLAYDLSVSGAGSKLSSIDSAFGLTFNPLPANSTSQVSPLPWNSNKLLLTGGARAYLANATVLSPQPGVFSTSAVLPDATSEAFFYRWADFNLTGRGGILPIEGAQVSAFYAYTNNQANNATANSLNALSTANPQIWGYVEYWDSVHGYPSYASSNAAGVAAILLASSNITAGTLPDGFFLGGYHIGISVPAVGVGSHWFNWSVSPYPSGVARPSNGKAGPDFGPVQQFASYFGAVNLGSVTVLANGAANTTVDIGQTLGVRVVATDAGTATITEISGNLYYNSSGVPSAHIAAFKATGLHLSGVGQQLTFTLNWTVIDKVTGLNGWFQHNLSLVLGWNFEVVSLGGGVVNRNVSLEFAPSQIALPTFSTPPTTLNLDQPYLSSGVVVYNGSQSATIELLATPVGGAGFIVIASTASLSGTFSMPWASLQQLLAPGTTYTLTARAYYNGRETNYTLPGTYSVPPPPTSAASFLNQKFLGLPLWIWLAIAAAAAIGIVLFLVVARRQAAGKLVECGECGNLIPEDATVCPKCGAEFESDLIRCSRCASTIPADSKFCPECAAQLLGPPGEAESDPEKQAYADFIEKYRAEAKRELGDNYSEGAFWDWWKRQPSYTPFSQWSLQQGQGTARMGMTAPPTGTETTPESDAGRMPPKKGGGTTEGSAPISAAPPAPAPSAIVPPPATGAAGLKPCPNCGKEIPSEYLVCPFCNAVTQ